MFDLFGFVTSVQERSAKSEQEIQCALKEIQRIYDMQEDRQEHLKQREEELNHREQDWEEEQAKRQEQATALEQKKAEIDAEIAQSTEKKENLAFEIAALQKQRDELKNEIEKEREAIQKEKDTLAEREEAVNQRETMLNVQEEMKKKQEAALQEMLTMKKQFMQIQAELRTVGQSFSHTGNLVEGSTIIPGLKELAVLHRQMAASQAKEVNFYDRLVVRVLSKFFGAEQIVPQNGEVIDYKWMECNNSENQGSIVENCVACGWKKGDSLLSRAIVTVKEK